MCLARAPAAGFSGALFRTRAPAACDAWSYLASLGRKEEVEQLVRFQRDHSMESQGLSSHGGMEGYHSPSKRTGESEDESDYEYYGPALVRPPHKGQKRHASRPRHKA
jgi:hypothetical protein